MITIILSILLIILNLADVTSTNRFISAGTGIEINPVIGFLQTTFGKWWWVPKMIIVVILVAGLWWLANIQPMANYLIAALCIFYTWTVIRNWRLV